MPEPAPRRPGFPFRTIAGLAVIVVISAPVSVVATILLFPLWSWLEASTGIESVGHSGPAEWCYIAVFLAIAGGATLLFFFRGPK